MLASHGKKQLDSQAANERSGQSRRLGWNKQGNQRRVVTYTEPPLIGKLNRRFSKFELDRQQQVARDTAQKAQRLSREVLLNKKRGNNVVSQQLQTQGKQGQGKKAAGAGGRKRGLAIPVGKVSMRPTALKGKKAVARRKGKQAGDKQKITGMK